MLGCSTNTFKMAVQTTTVSFITENEAIYMTVRTCALNRAWD